MAVYDLPAALRATAWEFGLARGGTQFRSPYTGSLQAVDFAADRWQASLMLPPVATANAGAAEAFFNRLSGGVNRVRLWHQARPTPAGTMRGQPVLTAGASRGQLSLSIGSARALRNAIAYAGFELDGDADGLSDGLAGYSAGSTGAVTYVRTAGYGSPGAQRVEATALGSADGDRAGFSWAARHPLAVAGPQMFAVDAIASANVLLVLSIGWYTAGGAFLRVDNAGLPVSDVQWTRLGFMLTPPGTAAQADVYLWMTRSSGLGSAALQVDNAQLEPGTSASAYSWPPTLRAGDMLGVGGQLFQVADDVTLNDAGAGTVNVVNRVRSSIASGSAVTWLRPTAEFYLPSPATRFAHQPGVLTPMAFDLEEFVA